MKFRNCCFTSFKTEPIMFDPEHMAYMITGGEICPGTERHHWQGYVEFHKQLGLKRVKELLQDPEVHVEPRKSKSAKAAVDYCKKEHDWKEFGTVSNQGKRTDIETVKELIGEKRSLAEIYADVPNYQCMRIADKLMVYSELQRTEKPKVLWFHGPTGTGKTRRAIELSGDSYWISGKSLRWWCGYDAHQRIIFDDFRRDFCTFHELLRILDRYPYRIENKGSTRQLLATQIIITSCFAPDALYDTREDIEQLLRRIDEIREFA